MMSVRKTDLHRCASLPIDESTGEVYSPLYGRRGLHYQSLSGRKYDVNARGLYWVKVNSEDKVAQLTWVPSLSIDAKFFNLTPEQVVIEGRVNQWLSKHEHNPSPYRQLLRH